MTFQYGVLFIAIGKKIESMQHTVAQVMYQLWTTMQAKRIQPSDVA
jgi:hypothetical protein